MLTLYYSPGACSLAPHIALQEAGASYVLELVSIPKGEQQAPEYLNVNPRQNTGAAHRRGRADRERRDPDLHRPLVSAGPAAAGRANGHGPLYLAHGLAVEYRTSGLHPHRSPGTLRH